MSDVMRWRYGDTNPVVADVDSAQGIEIGDLLYQETDDARPASYQTDAGSEAANQDLFASKFLGVSMQRHRASTDTNDIRVATTGVFEFPCPSSTWELGDLIGPSENGDGDALLDQQVEKVYSSGKAIGRCAKREASATTTVLVDIRSTVLLGGVEGSSASGM